MEFVIKYDDDQTEWNRHCKCETELSLSRSKDRQYVFSSASATAAAAAAAADDENVLMAKQYIELEMRTATTLMNSR